MLKSDTKISCSFIKVNYTKFYNFLTVFHTRMISKNLQRFVKGFVNQSTKTMSVQQRSFYEVKCFNYFKLTCQTN